MYRKWTKNDIEASKARFRRLYAKSPIEYRFLCGHDIQSEDDEDALDYYMIGYGWFSIGNILTGRKRNRLIWQTFLNLCECTG